MSDKANLRSNQAPSPQMKSDTSPASGMLTPSEIESLRQRSKENSAYVRKVLAERKAK